MRTGLLELLKKTTSELDPVKERIMLNGFLVLFMLAGVGFLYWARWEKKKVEQMEEITAICVEHVRFGSGTGSSRNYISVFEYTYCGVTYTERDAFHVGTNIGLPEVGEPCTVRIDHAHPEKPYYLNRSSNRFTVLMGVAFIAMGLFGVIMYNLQF